MAFSFRRRWPHILIVIILLIAVARIVAPYILQAQINKRLGKIPDYTGKVGTVHLSVLRGAYQLLDVNIVKRNGDSHEPFFAAKLIDFSIAWRKLFAGQLVSDIYVEDARVTFLNAPSPQASQLQADRRWQDAILDIFPINITRCQINRGTVRFIDTARTPKVDISIHDVQAIATGLRNRPSKTDEPYPSHITLDGTVLGSGHVSLDVQLEALAKEPHFFGKLNLTGVDLPQLDDFLRAYGHVDVSRGTLQVYIEAKAEKGAFDGYVKPFLQDLKFTNENIENDNLGKRVWQALVSALTKIVKNHEKNQVATQIPFSGRFDDPKVGVLATIRNLFSNGFVKALDEGFNSEKKTNEEK
ncbi:MAG TPA: DUF748 domain-containing protein, partial [Opitutaceae bacterium]